METQKDMISRLKLMSAGDPTWDLSDNDCAAIKYALENIEGLRVALKWALSTINCEPYEWTLQEDADGHRQALAALEK